MKFDMETPIKDLFGETAKKPDGEEVATLGFICLQALLAPVDQETTAQQKIKQYQLAQKIASSNDGTVELSVEDVAALKKLIGEVYASPGLVGAVTDILDPSGG